LRGRLKREEKRREAGRVAVNSGGDAIEDGVGFKRGIKGGKMKAGW
jgi:hypothetical protein